MSLRAPTAPADFDEALAALATPRYYSDWAAGQRYRQACADLLAHTARERTLGAALTTVERLAAEATQNDEKASLFAALLFEGARRDDFGLIARVLERTLYLAPLAAAVDKALAAGLDSAKLMRSFIDYTAETPRRDELQPVLSRLLAHDPRPELFVDLAIQQPRLAAVAGRALAETAPDSAAGLAETLAGLAQNEQASVHEPALTALRLLAERGHDLSPCEHLLTPLLARAPGRAGLGNSAAYIIMHSRMNAASDAASLLGDPRDDVRLGALAALGVRQQQEQTEHGWQLLTAALTDTAPAVANTAAARIAQLIADAACDVGSPLLHDGLFALHARSAGATHASQLLLALATRDERLVEVFRAKAAGLPAGRTSDALREALAGLADERPTRRCARCRQLPRMSASLAVDSVSAGLSVAWSTGDGANGEQLLVCPDCSAHYALSVETEFDVNSATEHVYFFRLTPRQIEQHRRLHGLAPLQTRRILAGLERDLHDLDPYWAQEAAAALARDWLDDGAVARLDAELLNHDRAAVRYEGLAPLRGYLQREPAAGRALISTLRALSRDEDARVRREAAATLVSIWHATDTTPDALPWPLDDEAWHGALAATAALAKADKPLPAALVALAYSALAHRAGSVRQSASTTVTLHAGRDPEAAAQALAWSDANIDAASEAARRSAAELLAHAITHKRAGDTQAMHARAQRALQHAPTKEAAAALTALHGAGDDLAPLLPELVTQLASAKDPTMLLVLSKKLLQRAQVQATLLPALVSALGRSNGYARPVVELLGLIANQGQSIEGAEPLLARLLRLHNDDLRDAAVRLLVRDAARRDEWPRVLTLLSHESPGVRGVAAAALEGLRLPATIEQRLAAMAQDDADYPKGSAARTLELLRRSAALK